MHTSAHHIAKRIHEERTSLYDKVMVVVGTAAAFMTLPQIISVWQHGPAGVSLFSWSAYTLHSVAWTIYGIVHRERIVISVNAVWAIMNALVVAGILIYR